MVQWARTVLPPTPTAPIRGQRKGARSLAHAATHIGADRADASIRESLAAKCQENGWLRAGGYAWQDDPYLEDYPYDIREASSMEELRSFFRRGNWAIRQGVVYRDLAFVQQVDGGDEWWTLKRTDSGWLAFESWSFGRIVQEPERFSHAIECMHRATPEQCKRLEYMEAVPSIEDAARRARDSIQQLNKTAMTPTRGARAELR